MAAAHHRAFRDTDGEDPEWPSWYADHLVGPLGDLGIGLTRSVIVFTLVGCERRHPDAGSAWPALYAAQLLAEAG